jgi:Ice-binding-like
VTNQYNPLHPDHINKVKEVNNAPLYPARRHNRRERKVLETAMEYTPSTPANWATQPTTIDDALDLLAGGAALNVVPTLATTILGAFKNTAGLAGAGVTNTGNSVVGGDLSTYPTASITGFPPGVVTGTQHPADATATAAQAQDTFAASYLSHQPTFQLSATTYDGAGVTLPPGQYSVGSSMTVGSGTLTLDAGGNPNARWIFTTGSTFSLANGTSITLVNGAQVDNVFFYVGSSATLGTTSTMRGNIVAATSITVNHLAAVHGRLWCSSGSLTLDTNAVSLT